MEVYLAVGIFLVIFISIIFEIFDKALLALLGAVLMVALNIISFEEATAVIDFATLILLMSMMMLVGITKKAGIITWLSVKIAERTSSSPFLIFILFCLLTLLLSMFLGNVTTVLLIIPVVLMLAQGTGKDPKLYLLGVIFSANLGGALSLVGDPSNIIIGTSANLTFNDFIKNLIIPVGVSTLLVMFLITLIRWDELRPIVKNLKKLFISNLLLEQIKHKFIDRSFDFGFNIKVIIGIFLTILGFIFESYIAFPIAIVPMFFVVMILMFARKNISIHEAFEGIEWTTLFFFIGLFIMVGGLEKVGLLEQIADFIINLTNSYIYLLIVILLISGFVSMLLDNVAFVTIMVPVILTIQTTLSVDQDPQFLWWALSMGACLGANGTAIGSAANVVGIAIAKKEGINLTFLEHLKFSLPLTILTLCIATIYLFIRV